MKVKSQRKAGFFHDLMEKRFLVSLMKFELSH